MKSLLEERLAREPQWIHRPAASFFFNNLPLLILLCAVFLLYGYFLSHKIDLVTADLGRHIKNGETLLQDASVLEQNFYSYTNPDFQVINHHWGSGFLFFLVWKFSGFAGVQVFFILLSLVALAVFLAAARLYARWDVVGLVALFVMPLLAERTEIRPEVWSYLFAGIFFLLLCLHREYQTRRTCKLLWLLPFFEMLWVNTHIYFLLGPLLIGAFLLEALIVQRERFLKLLGVFGVTLVATLVNPFGHRAITGALTLFENFGYRLAENQSVWFLERLGMTNPNFPIFKVLFGILVLSFLITIYHRWRDIRLAHVFVATGISVLALLASRNLTLFGFFFVPFLAANIHAASGDRLSGRAIQIAAAVFAAAALLLSVVFTVPRHFPYWRSFGFGLEEGNSAAAEFLRRENIRGPIFNNYDIGGYLIFHLFPDERVFVDNRPEAYPKEFFEKTYIPMQEDESAWRETLERHDFNTIVFSHHDATPWGQRFLVARVQDRDWAPVFADSRVLILVRRTAEHAQLIAQWELPPETFRLSR